ncbi:hypothetical protein VTN49DRAFT_6832 [Thermomyces lanuginosus]|uniref:uncharacterized protein n=1 Tax=Thermomyces lanuginosus TaxID=5541 RepID=UPI003742F49A
MARITDRAAPVHQMSQTNRSQFPSQSFQILPPLTVFSPVHPSICMLMNKSRTPKQCMKQARCEKKPNGLPPSRVRVPTLPNDPSTLSNIPAKRKTQSESHKQSNNDQPDSWIACCPRL